MSIKIGNPTINFLQASICFIFQRLQELKGYTVSLCGRVHIARSSSAQAMVESAGQYFQ